MRSSRRSSPDHRQLRSAGRTPTFRKAVIVTPLEFLPIVHLVHLGPGIGRDLARIRVDAGMIVLVSRSMRGSWPTPFESKVRYVDTWHGWRSDGGDRELIVFDPDAFVEALFA